MYIINTVKYTFHYAIASSLAASHELVHLSSHSRLKGSTCNVTQSSETDLITVISTAGYLAVREKHRCVDV